MKRAGKLLYGVSVFVIAASSVSAQTYDNPAGSTIPGGVILSTETVITNSGTLGNPALSQADALRSTAANANITNFGALTGAGVIPWGPLSMHGSGSVFINSATGVVNSYGWTAGVNLIDGVNQRVVNNGLFTSPDNSGGWGVWVQNPLTGGPTTTTTIINNGVITSTASGNAAGQQAIGIYLEGNTGAYNIVNTGRIIIDSQSSCGDNWGCSAGISIRGATAVLNITNTGTLQGLNGALGIENGGFTVSALNNSQGAGNAAGALAYRGPLPVNYNIIINSPTQYGQLAAAKPSGSMIFGISTESSVSAATYAGVLQGVSAGNLSNTTGKFSRYNWTLVNSSGTTWDLLVALSGPSAADTQQSIVGVVSALRGAYALQSSVMASGFTYDCSLFDARRLCVSTGARNTAVRGHGINKTSGVLIGAYRLDQQNNTRIGVWVDQNVSLNSPANVKFGDSSPMVGVFGVWSQRPDGVGGEVKVSAAYGKKDAAITRQVVGSSESGSGDSQLLSQGLQVVAKFGVMVSPDVVLSPYAGLRHTQTNMGGYTETTNPAVTTPLTYAALRTNATTVLAGAEARYVGIPKTALFAGVGVESDTSTRSGSSVAAGMDGLTPVSLNPNEVRNRVRVSLGGFYDVLKNQRIGVTGIHRQEAFRSATTTTVLATYTFGL